jgi:hypothetical protein
VTRVVEDANGTGSRHIEAQHQFTHTAQDCAASSVLDGRYDLEALGSQCLGSLTQATVALGSRTAPSLDTTTVT